MSGDSTKNQSISTERNLYQVKLLWIFYRSIFFTSSISFVLVIFPQTLNRYPHNSVPSYPTFSLEIFSKASVIFLYLRKKKSSPWHLAHEPLDPLPHYFKSFYCDYDVGEVAINICEIFFMIDGIFHYFLNRPGTWLKSSLIFPCHKRSVQSHLELLPYQNHLSLSYFHLSALHSSHWKLRCPKPIHFCHLMAILSLTACYQYQRNQVHQLHHHFSLRGIFDHIMWKFFYTHTQQIMNASSLPLDINFHLSAYYNWNIWNYDYKNILVFSTFRIFKPTSQLFRSFSTCTSTIAYT